MARIRRMLYKKSFMKYFSIKHSNVILPHKQFQMMNLLESSRIDNFNAPPLTTKIGENHLLKNNLATMSKILHRGELYIKII